MKAKKALSILIALCMCLSLFPISAMAAEVDPESPDAVAYVTTNDGVKYYDNFADAVANRKYASSVITLLDDIDTPFTLSSDVTSVKITDNGHDITILPPDNAYLNVKDQYSANPAVKTYTFKDKSAANVHVSFDNGKYSNDEYVTFSTSMLGNPGVFTLLDDVSLTQRLTVGILAKDITIDLNGHTFTSTATDCAILTGNDRSDVTLLITDSSDGKGGTIVADNADQAITLNGSNNHIIIDEGVSIEGSCIAMFGPNQTLDVYGTIIGSDDFAIATNGSQTSNATINIYDGALVDADEVAMYLPSSGTTTISGGVILADTAVYVKSATLDITGGTLYGVGDVAAYRYNGNGCYATGDALVIDNCGYPGGVPVVSISDGELSSTNGLAVASYVKQDDATQTGEFDRVTGFVTGGLFSNDVTDYIAAGYASVLTESGWAVSRASTSEGEVIPVEIGDVEEVVVETTETAQGVTYDMTVGAVEVAITVDKEAAEANSQIQDVTPAQIANMVASVYDENNASYDTVEEAAAAVENALNNGYTNLGAVIGDTSESGDSKTYDVSPVLYLKASANGDVIGQATLTNEQLALGEGEFINVMLPAQTAGLNKVEHVSDDPTRPVETRWITAESAGDDMNVPVTHFSRFTVSPGSAVEDDEWVYAVGDESHNMIAYYDGNNASDFIDAAAEAIDNDLILFMQDSQNHTFAISDATDTLTIWATADVYPDPTIISGVNGYMVVIEEIETDDDDFELGWEYTMQPVSGDGTSYIVSTGVPSMKIKNGEAAAQNISVPVYAYRTNGDDVYGIYGLDFNVSLSLTELAGVTFVPNTTDYSNISVTQVGTGTHYAVTVNGGLNPSTGQDATFDNTPIGYLNFVTVENATNTGTGYASFEITNITITPDQNNYVETESLANVGGAIPFVYKLTLTGMDSTNGPITSATATATEGIISGETAGVYWADPDTTATLSAQLKQGYHFTSWTASAGSIAETTPATNPSTGEVTGYTYTMPKDNVTLTAAGAANTYTLVWNGNSADSGTIENTSVTYNNNAAIVSGDALSKTGHNFNGWALTSTATTPAYTVTNTPSANDLVSAAITAGQTTAGWYSNGTIEFFAVWQAGRFHVTLDVIPNSTATLSMTATNGIYTTADGSTAAPADATSGYVLFADTVTVIATPSTGYEVAATPLTVATDDDSTAVALVPGEPYKFEMIGEAVTATAHMVKRTYTVTFQAGGDLPIFVVSESPSSTKTMAKQFEATLAAEDMPTFGANYFLNTYTWNSNTYTTDADLIAAFAVRDTGTDDDANVINVTAYRRFNVNQNADLQLNSTSTDPNAPTADSKDGYSAFIVDYDPSMFGYIVTVSNAGVEIANSDDSNSGLSIAADGTVTITGDALADQAAGSTLTLTVTKTIVNVDVKAYHYVNNLVLLVASSSADVDLCYNGAAMYKDNRFETSTLGTKSYAIIIDITKDTLNYAPSDYQLGESPLAEPTELQDVANIAKTLITINPNAAAEIDEDTDVNLTGLTDISDLALVYNAYLGGYTYPMDLNTGVLTDRMQQFLLSDAYHDCVVNVNDLAPVYENFN